MCGLLDGLDALTARGRSNRRSTSCWSAAARGRAAYRQVLADLAGRPVVVPDAGEHVAAGACVQAAAVLHGAHRRVAARDVESRAAPTSSPTPSVDRAAIRAAYAAARG